jgi:hypothetical protein
MFPFNFFFFLINLKFPVRVVLITIFKRSDNLLSLILSVFQLFLNSFILIKYLLFFALPSFLSLPLFYSPFQLFLSTFIPIDYLLFFAFPSFFSLPRFFPLASNYVSPQTPISIKIHARLCLPIFFFLF